MIKSISRPQKIASKDFEPAVEQLFYRLMQMADNAGATDEHRALNYCAARYPAVYATAADAFRRNSSLNRRRSSPLPSNLTGVRRIVEVISSYTNRQTDCPRGGGGDLCKDRAFPTAESCDYTARLDRAGITDLPLFAIWPSGNVEPLEQAEVPVVDGNEYVAARLSEVQRPPRSDVGDRGRQGEHDVEVGHGQEIGLSLRQPVPCGGSLTLGAVAVAAGVVGDLGVGLNAVETFFPRLTRRRLKRSVFHSLVALQTAINRFHRGPQP